jgi:hypothetical protein
MTVVNAEMVMDGIARLAKDRPGIYSQRGDDPALGCVNIEVLNGEMVGSCIVGSFLLDVLGVSAQIIPENAGWRGTLRQVERYTHFEFDSEARHLLGMAQVLQDGKEISWKAISHSMVTVLEVMREYVSYVEAERDSA